MGKGVKFSSHVQKLCVHLDASQTPQLVPVIPEPYCQPTNCFFNVLKKIEFDGGERCIGWSISELKNVMLDAEFHAVWVSPDDQLIDVTPRQDGKGKIIFQPDTTRTYDLKPRANVQIPILVHSSVDEYIRISSRDSQGQTLKVECSCYFSIVIGSIPQKQYHAHEPEPAARFTRLSKECVLYDNPNSVSGLS